MSQVDCLTVLIPAISATYLCTFPMQHGYSQLRHESCLYRIVSLKTYLLNNTVVTVSFPQLPTHFKIIKPVKNVLNYVNSLLRIKYTLKNMLSSCTYGHKHCHFHGDSFLRKCFDYIWITLNYVISIPLRHNVLKQKLRNGW